MLEIRNSLSPRAGYTIVEILVGLAIMAIIFSLGFVSYREFSRRQELAGVTKQVKGDLRLAQELALAGKKPVVCLVLEGYYFVVSPPNGYNILAVCGGATVVEKSVSLPISVTLSGLFPDLSPTNSILFKSLGQGTNIPTGQISAFTLTQAVTLNTNTITVTAGGEIR